ncbi:hypothetical protein [Nocardioides zeae]
MSTARSTRQDTVLPALLALLLPVVLLAGLAAGSGSGDSGSALVAPLAAALLTATLSLLAHARAAAVPRARASALGPTVTGPPSPALRGNATDTPHHPLQPRAPEAV